MSVHIAINSACNNNCRYCFRESLYQSQAYILEYDEIMKIFDWSLGSPSMGLSGGEPTLHPDCYKICEESSKRFNTTFYTNLTAKTSLISKLMQLNMGWLVNVNVREELFDQFEANMYYINKLAELPKGTYGITLTGNLKEDIGYIKKLLRVGKTYPNAIKSYRIGLVLPCDDKEFKLYDFNKSILEFYKMMDLEGHNFPIIYDCSINNCQITPKTMLKILQDRRTSYFQHYCMPSRVDIGADRRINFCASVPFELFKDVTDYRMFNNWYECYQWIGQVRANFMAKHEYFCKNLTNCTNKSCPGTCFAMTARMVKEEEKRSKITQAMHKIRREINDAF